MNGPSTQRQPIRRLAPIVGLGLWIACAPLVAEELPWGAGNLGSRLPVDDESGVRTSVEVESIRARMLAPAAPHAGLDGRTTDELAGLSYRYWMGRGRTELGIGIGSMGYLTPQRLDGPRSVIGSVPTLSVALRYRVSGEHLLFADASGARGLGVDPTAAYVTTRVGMEWAPAKSVLGFSQGALGLQLDSGYRLSLRMRHGSPVLYLRTQF